MILNQAQAEAIYIAMSALNNVGNVVCEFNLPNDVWIQAGAFGGVTVVPHAHGAKIEQYRTQAEFASAYGLQ